MHLLPHKNWIEALLDHPTLEATVAECQFHMTVTISVITVATTLLNTVYAIANQIDSRVIFTNRNEFLLCKIAKLHYPHPSRQQTARSWFKKLSYQNDQWYYPKLLVLASEFSNLYSEYIRYHYRLSSHHSFERCPPVSKHEIHTHQ